MPQIAKYLLITGAALILIGIVWWLFPGLFSRLGRLPGDIRVENENGGFYFPIVTCLVLSILLSAIIWLARRFL
ncbi:MAG TPA: DUF2905 domain-containing protein [Bacteroidia bacterium]|nr:DUF2905 domain-containing protein [Bacteroidia bacterium]